MGFAEKFLGRPGTAGFTADMLEAFVDLKQEENVNLEYKRTDTVSNPVKLAITCSAFANADGGLLVLGVDEEEEQDEKGQVVRVRPGRVRWGPKTLTREKLESVLISRIHPWISGMRIYPVRKEEGGVAFLVDIPQSANPPHQAPDRKYYLRYNFQNLPMEHNQIAALFLRRLRPDLRPGMKVHAIDGTIDAISIEISLHNDGGALAKYPMMILTFEDSQNVMVEDETTSFFVDSNLSRKGKFRVFSFHKEIPLYSQMSRTVGKVIARPSKDGVLAVSMTVCAEDMPTRRFQSGISLEFLRKQTTITPDKPLILAIASPDDLGDELTRKVVQQMGMEWEEFTRMVTEIFGAEIPPDGPG